jgi:hypothetical protein
MFTFSHALRLCVKSRDFVLNQSLTQKGIKLLTKTLIYKNSGLYKT